MGIQGLLPLFKSIMVPIHIKDLKGCTVAVDTYSWLHKGAFSCSRELCKGIPTSRHIEYCMHRVNLLLHNGVKPILVFDGGPLPMKIEQENKRARTRKENLERAIDHESCGNSSAAYECYQKALDISPLIAHGLIQVLKQQNIPFIVAPYEADAQMTFLALRNQVDAVITEDSDLIPFGCPRIIYKMDKFGQGLEFKYSMLSQNKNPNFAGFTKQMLLEMCILSGCDYLPSLPGMGVRRAHALITKFKSYEKVIKHLRYNTLAVPPLYEESFKKAILTFQHQRVYDPITENIVLLSHSSDVGGDLEFLGPAIPQHIAKGIAKGDLDPFTQDPLEGQSVCLQMEVGINSDEKISKPKSERKKLELPVQKNLLTKYFCFTSLEARRNFKAPRTSPKSPSHSPTDCFTSDEKLSMEDTSSEIGCSFSSCTDSENAEDVSLNVNVQIDDFSSSIPKISNFPCLTVLDEMRHLDDSPKPPASHSEDHLSSPLHQKHEGRIGSDVVGSGTRTENGKVVVKSRFFQDKQVNKKDLQNKQDASHDNDCHEANPVSTSTDVKDGEVKFGSNISHIERYSNIAEKSIDRFVSVISSFRYSSSGTRASGLRAPLKDVTNSRTKRSPTCVEFEQFAYEPAKKKTRIQLRQS